MVSNHKIVSGTAKGGAVSVFYVKGESDPNVSVEAASKEFSSDNVKVTLRAQDADNLKYTTTEGESGSFTDGKVISVGKTLSIGETATVKVTGTAAKDGKKVKKGQALSASVTVKKVESRSRTLPRSTVPTRWAWASRRPSTSTPERTRASLTGTAPC